MSKATSVYLIILAIFGGALWAILSIGNVYLHAPTDVSGPWQLWTSADATAPVHTMNIEQSGRFVRLEFERRVYDLKMTHDRQTTPPQVEFRGSRDLTVSFDAPGDQPGDYMIHLTGPIQGSFLGTRGEKHSAAPSTQPLSNDAKL